MSKLWILLKVELRETFFPAPDANSSKRRKRTSGGGYLAMLILAAVIMVAFLSMYLVLLAEPLRRLGLLRLYPAIGVAGASIFVLVTTIYKTNGMLFGFKDYDMVTALPFKTSTVVACRFLLLYIWNLLFTLAVMLPVGIIYGFFEQVPVGYWPVYFIQALLTPLLPCVIAALIGMAIGLATSHMQRSGIANTIVTIVVLVAWILFCLSFSTLSDEEALNAVASAAPQIMQTITGLYPPAAWFTSACCDLNMGMFALFAVISIGAFAAFVTVVAKNFGTINARLKPKPVKANYQMTALTGMAPRKALARREWKRLAGSSTYLLNTCIGYMMVVIFSVILAVTSSSGTSIMSSLDEAIRMMSEESGMAFHPTVLASMFFGMFMLISAPTLASVSLEGKSFWISKTIPVATWDILRSKLSVGYTLVIAVSLISGIMMWIAFGDTGIFGILFFLIPLAYGLFAVLQGMWLNLKYPDFDWTAETKVVKQGRPAMTLSFLGLGIGLAGFFLFLFFGDIVPLIAVPALAVWSLFLYRTLRTKGVRAFDECTG